MNDQNPKRNRINKSNQQLICFADAEWCERGSGPIEYDSARFHISRTRDGGLWLRFGSEGHMDNAMHNLTHAKRYLVVISNNQAKTILTSNYTDYCALSDFEFSLTSTVSKRKSFLTVIDVISKVKKNHPFN